MRRQIIYLVAVVFLLSGIVMAELNATECNKKAWKYSSRMGHNMFWDCGYNSTSEARSICNFVQVLGFEPGVNTNTSTPRNQYYLNTTDTGANVYFVPGGTKGDFKTMRLFSKISLRTVQTVREPLSIMTFKWTDGTGFKLRVQPEVFDKCEMWFFLVKAAAHESTCIKDRQKMSDQLNLTIDKESKLPGFVVPMS